MTTDPERLLSHRGFVRALVRRLLDDEHQVDDVEQQTWMAAMRAGPRDAGKLRGWLGAVARNFARRHVRDEQLRRAREPDGDRPPPERTAHEFLEQEERRREVVAAVMRLAEPYRTVVLLRWFKELPPKEIAKQLGVPVETVKTQLRRGHDRLRVDLDARHGGERRAWVVWLAPLAWPESAAAGTAIGATLTGVVTMKAMAWVTTGVLVVAATVVYLAGDRNDDEASSPPAVAERVDAIPEAPSVEPTVERTARESLESRANVAPETTPDADGAEAGGTLALSGVVITPLGEPVAGAHVTIRRREWAEFSSLDLASSRDERVLLEGETDERGSFRFPLVPGLPVDVAVEAAGYPIEVLASRHAGESLTIRLREGARLFGTVTRARDGLPVEGVYVRGWGYAGGAELFDGHTDERGRYSFDSIAPAQMHVEFRPVREKSPGWMKVHLEPGESRQLDVVLEDGIRVHGRVTDATTGAPIAGAELSHGWTFRRMVTTDADGRFEMPGFGASGVYDIHVRADGYGRTETADMDLDDLHEELELDFALMPGRRVLGRVVDGAGRPVIDAYVAAVSNLYDESDRGNALWSQGTQRSDWRSTRTAGDGTFAIGSLRPDTRHALLVRADGYGVAVVDFPADEHELGVIDVGDVRLASPIVLAGRVRDQHGQPVPRAHVELTGDPAGRFALSGRDEPWFTGYVDERSTVADDSGRFLFRAVAPGRYELHPERGREETGPAVVVVLEEGSGRRDVDLEIQRGLAISGRVEGPFGDDVNQVVVSVTGPGGEMAGMRVVRPDGTFVVKGLDPGTYSLVARPLKGVDAAGGRSLRASEPAVVDAGSSDVLLRLREASVIAGRVVDRNGEGVARAIVTARDASGQKVGGTFTSDLGRFEIDVAPAGRFTVEVQLTRQTTDPGKAFEVIDGPPTTIDDVPAGASDVVVEVELN